MTDESQSPQPAEATAPQEGVADGGSAAPPPGKPWYRKWRYIIPIAVLVIVVAAVALSPNNDPESASASASPESQSATATQSTAPSSTSESAAPPSSAPASSVAPSTDESDQGIVFGEPAVFEESGLTTVAVMAENVGDEVKTFFVQATFRSGETIAATATGSVNDLAPGDRRAVTMLADESPLPAYDNVRVEVDTMIDQGPTNENSEIAEQLVFGEPRINSDAGFTTVTVEVTNNSDTQISLFVGTAFLDGETILGTASGAVNDLAAGETQTADLIVTGSAEGYTEILLYPETIIAS